MFGLWNFIYQNWVFFYFFIYFLFQAFDCIGGESDTLPYVQTLRKFPKEQLVKKVVLVRFDSTILVQEEAGQTAQSASNALFTIKYLHEAGAKVILVSGWSVRNNLKLFDSVSIAGTVLRRKVFILFVIMLLLFFCFTYIGKFCKIVYIQK